MLHGDREIVVKRGSEVATVGLYCVLSRLV